MTHIPPENQGKGRPHHNDNVRWMELFAIAGVIMYENPEPEPEPVLMTIDEFMDFVEEDMRKHGIQITSWRLGQ